jgi:hypothetical protein
MRFVKTDTVEKAAQKIGLPLYFLENLPKASNRPRRENSPKKRKIAKSGVDVMITIFCDF